MEIPCFASSTLNSNAPDLGVAVCDLPCDARPTHDIPIDSPSRFSYGDGARSEIRKASGLRSSGSIGYDQMRIAVKER